MSLVVRPYCDVLASNGPSGKFGSVELHELFRRVVRIAPPRGSGSGRDPVVLGSDDECEDIVTTPRGEDECDPKRRKTCVNPSSTTSGRRTPIDTFIYNLNCDSSSEEDGSAVETHTACSNEPKPKEATHVTDTGGTTLPETRDDTESVECIPLTSTHKREDLFTKASAIVIFTKRYSKEEPQRRIPFSVYVSTDDILNKEPLKEALTKRMFGVRQNYGRLSGRHSYNSFSLSDVMNYADYIINPEAPPGSDRPDLNKGQKAYLDHIKTYVDESNSYIRDNNRYEIAFKSLFEAEIRAADSRGGELWRFSEIIKVHDEFVNFLRCRTTKYPTKWYLANIPGTGGDMIEHTDYPKQLEPNEYFYTLLFALTPNSDPSGVSGTAGGIVFKQDTQKRAYSVFGGVAVVDGREPHYVEENKSGRPRTLLYCTVRNVKDGNIV